MLDARVHNAIVAVIACYSKYVHRLSYPPLKSALTEENMMQYDSASVLTGNAQ